MKKIVSTVLAVVLLVAVLSVHAVPAVPKDVKVVSSGSELQAVLDDAKSGAELYIKLVESIENSPLEIGKTVQINKSCKIYFENGKPGGDLFLQCTTGSAFYVTGEDVELHFGKGIYLEGNHADIGNGEAFYVDGKDCLIDRVGIRDCGTMNWQNDWGNRKNGGAIYVNKPGCTIQNCTFENCLDCDGGAVYVNAVDCTIQKCTFEACKGYDGGAICINQHNCHIINCGFTDCNAEDYGGGVYVCSYTYGIVVSHCTFNNVSAYYGQYFSGAQDAKAFDCSPHWGEKEYYSKWCSFETADPLKNHRKNNPSKYLNSACPEEGYYIIRTAVDPNYCLDIDDGSGQGEEGNLRLWQENSANAKIFKIEKAFTQFEYTAYTIMAVNSEKFLEVQPVESDPEEGANIRQWTDRNHDEDGSFFVRQRWIFEGDPVAENCYYIHCLPFNIIEGGWMDAAGMAAGQNVNVYGWSYTGAKNQMWILEKVDYTPPSGFTLSNGTWWIIAVGAVVILGGVAAVVIVGIGRKKKKAAQAQ